MAPKNIIGILFILIIIIWIWRQDKLFNIEIESIKKMELKGTILKMFKKEGHKNFTITLSGNREYDLPYFAPTDKIDPGDSIFKASNSFKYVFFKNRLASDTIVFEGMVNGKYIP